jgi:hypothetical protein
MYGRHEHALADFNLAIKLDPVESSGYYRRSMLLKELGRKTEAVEDMKSYLARKGDPAWRAEAEKVIRELSVPAPG